MSNEIDIDFDAVVREETPRLYALCFRLCGNIHEAEDLCTETFTKAFRAKGSFQGRAQIGTWLYRIAVNSWKNMLRSKSRHQRHEVSLDAQRMSPDEDADPVDPPGDDPSPETFIERRESVDLLQKALGTLDPEEREIIVLRDLEEKSYDEIADLLQIPLGTVKSRLSRARESLRNKLAPILKSKGEL